MRAYLSSKLFFVRLFEFVIDLLLTEARLEIVVLSPTGVFMPSDVEALGIVLVWLLCKLRFDYILFI